MQPQSEILQKVGEEMIDDAKSVGASVINRLHSKIDARKGDAAAQLQSVSSTFERAALTVDADAPDWLRPALEQGARQVQKFADTLHQNDSRDIAGQVNEFAKKSPGTFLGTCAVIGFVAARVFKAGSNENTPPQPGAITPEKSLSTSLSPNTHQPSGFAARGMAE